jgi:hypothetical protein
MHRALFDPVTPEDADDDPGTGNLNEVRSRALPIKYSSMAR